MWNSLNGGCEGIFCSSIKKGEEEKLYILFKMVYIFLKIRFNKFQGFSGSPGQGARVGSLVEELRSCMPGTTPPKNKINLIIFSHIKKIIPHLVKVAQLCPTLYDSMDCTVHGILQARVLEWVAFPFSRGSSQLRDQSQVSSIEGGFFTSWATKETIVKSLQFHLHQAIITEVSFPNLVSGDNELGKGYLIPLPPPLACQRSPVKTEDLNKMLKLIISKMSKIYLKITQYQEAGKFWSDTDTVMTDVELSDKDFKAVITKMS